MSVEVRYKTKYPKIFSCYWGNFPYRNDDKSWITDEIIENRNKFVEEFEITRRKDIPIRLNTFLGEYGLYGGRRKYYDHVETYYTKTKQHIIIISPYLDNKFEDYDEIIRFFEKGEFKLYNKLYSMGAYTFIRVVNYDSATRKYF